jgi:hypothetical protein
MFTKLREPFGTAGLLVAIVALVFALAGGAYAASGGLTGKQKTEVTKIAKQYAGKPGPAGSQGANGGAGPQGSAGLKGDNGAPGANGANGANGTNGTSGFTSTLPAGKTETGQFAFAEEDAPEEAAQRTALSFSIPLKEPAVPHFIGEGEGEGEANEHLPAGCKGNAEKPKAEPGNLCVFGKVVQATAFVTFFDAGSGTADFTGTSGDTLLFNAVTVEPFPGFKETAQAIGTWAVTAETE